MHYVKNPCNGCPDRFVREESGKLISCRSSCEQWARHEENKKAEYKRRKDASMFDDAKYEAIKCAAGKGMDFNKYRKEIKDYEKNARR